MFLVVSLLIAGLLIVMVHVGCMNVQEATFFPPKDKIYHSARPLMMCRLHVALPKVAYMDNHFCLGLYIGLHL